MKPTIFLFAIIFLAASAAVCQNINNMDRWFFNASVKNTSKENQALLQADPMLTARLVKPFIRTNHIDSGYHYFGMAAKQLLFNKYPVDSAVMLSTIGSSTLLNDQRYKGYINFFSVEYFIPDDATLQDLFKLAKNDFKTQVIKKSKAKVRSHTQTGELVKYTYIDEKDSLQEVEIWATQDIITNIYSLKIIHRIAGK